MEEVFMENVVERNEKNSEEKLAEKRAKKRLIQKRWRQRSKLKIRVAEFIRRLHMSKARMFTQGELSAINAELFKAIKLPYCWNDTDLRRANAALTGLDKKYFDRSYVQLTKDEADLTTFIKNSLDDSKLTKAEKASVVINVLADVGREFVMEAGDGITPSPDAAFLLLTQNMGGTLPKWFAGSLADLLEERFTRSDITGFLWDLYKILGERDERKYGAADRERRAAEEYAKFIAETDAIDASGFTSAIGAKMKK